MIYLLRHGQTDWNLLKKLNGGTDSGLNQTGINQAKEQAENLKTISFDACFCSPLKRARDFCEIIRENQAVCDDRLTEINCGEFEGTEESDENLKLFSEAVKTGDRSTENFQEFIKRNCDFCNMVTDKYKGKNVLIVTHAANARVINYYFCGKPKDYSFFKAVIPNGGLLTFEN